MWGHGVTLISRQPNSPGQWTVWGHGVTLISRQPGTVECVGSWSDVDQPTARDSGLCGVMA